MVSFITSARCVILLQIFMMLGAAFAQHDPRCNKATVSLVESLPQDLNIPNYGETTFDAWMRLISTAKKTIDIGCFYVTLTEGKEHLNSGGWMGVDLYEELINAHRQNNVTIRIVQNESNDRFPNLDSEELQKMGVASVRSVPWEKLFGSGVLHSKFLIVDDEHFYLGSANVDWRSMAQVKELGTVVQDCRTLAEDLRKIFDQYWIAAVSSELPKQWPASYRTEYNVSNPFAFQASDGSIVNSFLASSPPHLVDRGTSRTHDLEAILNAINTAEKSISFSIMDYIPTSLYKRPNYYWPPIDNALRRAASERKVKVQLLLSLWAHSKKDAFQYMHSLHALDNIEVKMMHIHELPEPIPFTRVNHAKYMVTDKLSYITTSNCAADYFIDTGGVSITLENNGIRNQLQRIFDRDFTGPYAIPLPPQNKP